VREAGYKDTRVRLQRVKDAKFFSGWVMEMGGDSASVLLNDSTSMEVGNILVGEVCGRDNRALIDAVVSTVEEDLVSLGFRRTPRYEVARECSRTLVRNVIGNLCYQGEVVDVQVLDVSAKGIGLLTYAPLQPGDRVNISLESPHGPIKVGGQVRYCRPDAKRIGLYRAGLFVDELGRLDRARWQKLNGQDPT